MGGIINAIFGGGGGGSSAPAADPNVGNAALAQANLSKEQLDWAKQIYAETAPQRAASIARANQVSDAQLASMNQNTAIAKDYNDYAKGTFRPLEQGIVAASQTYDTQSRRDSEAAKGVADVESSFASQQAQQSRALERSGINPSSGKSLALGNQLGIAAAAAKAGAAAKGRNTVEMQGYARKMDAANLGRNLASNQATSAGVALNAGNAAANTGAMSGGINAQGNAIMQSGFSGASQSMGSAGGLYAQDASIANQAAAQNASSDNQLFSTLGQVGGMMMMSDKNIKTAIKGINPNAALQAVNKTPVSKWKYKPGSIADDGGMEHTGPMAQDVQATMGSRVAPKGKAIDLISANGINMAAIQALTSRVSKLESAKGLRRSK